MIAEKTSARAYGGNFLPVSSYGSFKNIRQAETLSSDKHSSLFLPVHQRQNNFFIQLTAGTCIITLFTAVIKCKLECVSVSHLHPSSISPRKAEAYLCRAPLVLGS